MFVPVPADLREGSRSCSLFYIARRLGYGERSEGWLVSYVDCLISHEGFPPPLPLYRVTGGSRRKVDRLGGGHRWNRDAVDAWFDGTIPPKLAAVVEDGLAARYAAQLDARAAALGAVA